jgi:DNA-binding NtrC family response regulator
LRQPQLLIHEFDERLADSLRETAKSQAWALREPRQIDACLRLLKNAGPSVLVVRLGRDLQHELTLLERVSWLRPEIATVVVGDTEDVTLACLAWDLGASYVLFPPQSRDCLPDIVRGLMGQATGKPGLEELPLE